MKQNITNHSNHSAGKIHIALLLGAGIALAGLTGCGQNSGASQSSSAPDSIPEQTAAVAPATAPAAPSPEQGKQLFATACATCHGPQGLGIPHLGKNLQTSEFAAGLSDSKLADFITQGRAANDPLNTTHVPMPPKGGNPALSAQDISDIVAYIRQLQQPQTAAK